MNIKMDLFEDLKIEELKFEYESYQEGSQIFADIDANLTSVEGSEIKELEEKSNVNSKTESNEELNTNFIKSKKNLMIEKKLKPCSQYLTEFTTLRNVSSLLKKINDKCLETKLDSDEERFFAQLVKSKYPLVLLNKFSHTELKKSSNSKKEFFLIENIKEEPEEEHGQIQHESNEEKLSSCLKSSNFKTENIKEEPVEEHEQIQHESNEEKLSSCLRISNSKNEIFLLENIKEEPEEEEEQSSKNSNSKNEIFLLENIKEEPEEEDEQSSFTGLDIEGMDSHTKKQVIRERIISLFESGRTKTEIAKTLGIQVATVRRWIVRHEKEGNLCDRPKPGAPRRTTLNEDKKIIQETNKNPYADSRAIKRALGLKVSDRTIRRRLHAPYSNREAKKTDRGTQT
ncbi:UNVERIFIED_CONTAM: hypothetical protein RMT77_015286 [Armadillidium vulgare]